MKKLSVYVINFWRVQVNRLSGGWLKRRPLADFFHADFFLAELSTCGVSGLSVNFSKL